MIMTRPQAPGGGRRPVMQSPADFNRLARLTQFKIGSVAYGENLKAQVLQCSPVGYYKGFLIYHDIDCGTSSGTPTGRFLSGHVGGNTNRFMAPTGLISLARFSLNIGSPIFSADGWGMYLLQLAQDRGRNLFTQNASSDIGYARRERGLFAIYNATDGTLAKPDDTVTASKNYKLRATYNMPLAMGEAASAGLVPVQDIRINPQLSFDFGARADFASVAADFGTAPTGNLVCYCDYFTVPDIAIRPDTDFLMQTVYETRAIAATGDQDYRPQIGGIILKMLMSVFVNSKGVDDFTAYDGGKLTVQQSLGIENRGPETFYARECRFNSKFLPNGTLLWDHTTGLGDPGFPSLRDRLSTMDLTDFKYTVQINSGVSLSGTSEIRAYRQQLLSVAALRG